MLGKEPVAKVGNRGSDVRIAVRLDREAELGVESHRTVGEVGRTDQRKAIVDDQNLAVHVETALVVGEPRQLRASRR